jgi:hypothetical protein
MNPFDSAWALLKTDVLLNRERAMEEYGLDLDDPRVYYNHAFFNESPAGLTPPQPPTGFLNLTHPMFAPPEDSVLHEQLSGSAAHEGFHAALQNTPEMIDALKNAREQATQGNLRPLIQLRLVHELMASSSEPNRGNSDNSHEALRHDLGFKDDAEVIRIRGEERDKIREQRRKAGRR